MLLRTGSRFHSHEYNELPNHSPRLQSSSLRIPLSRSAFSAPVPTTSTIIGHPSPILRRPLRSLSEIATARDSPIVRFQELEQDTMSEDGRSEASVTTAGGRSRRKRSLRTSTTFQLAHPAPTASQRLNIRPNLLLQLQQISATARPKPFLDVLPSTTLAPRLRTRFPRMFRSKAELGCNDVMIVKSEDYEGSVENKYEGGDSDEDGLDRELVAVICQMPKDSGGSQGKAEAVLSDGTVWACSPNLNGPNGPYEFEKTDAQGKTTIARWVKAKNPEATMNANREMKFTFSMIDPKRRKHPILATITPNRLDISDSYTTTSSSAGINSPTSSTFRTSGEEAEESEGDAAPERKVIVVEEDMKTIIRVTGVWVALRQGWSQCFKYNDTVTLPHAQTSPGSANRKSMSWPHDIVPGRLSPAPTVASMPESCRSSLGSVLGGKIRRASGIGSPVNGGSPQFDRLPTKPKRAVSSGTAFMQRAARRAGNAISPVRSEGEGEGESESMMEPKKRVIQSDDANGHRRSAPPLSNLAADSPTTTPETTPETTTQSQKRPSSYQPTTGSSLQEGLPQPAARRRSSAFFPLPPQNTLAKNGRSWQATPSRAPPGPSCEETMEEAYTNSRNHAQVLQGMVHAQSNDAISRATSPGLGFSSNGVDTEKEKRYRPRTYPYFQLLPYPVEAEKERNAALTEILTQLYVALKAEDISPGALHWTRELRGWLNLKFEITRGLRIKLVQMYYMLAVAPGLDWLAAERFESMFRFLIKKKHYLKPGEDLILDWRPLWKEIKALVLPQESPSKQAGRKRSYKSIANMCMFASQYFDPRDRQAMLEELLPYFTTSDISGAFIVVGALNLLMPTHAAPDGAGQLQPQDYLPTFFHLWSLVNRSKICDVMFFDLFSRLARDSLTSEHVPFSEFGIFTKDQSDLIFTALLRLTEIPVGQATSPYSSMVDLGAGLGAYLERDKKKVPVGYSVARWIVMSLSPACIDKPGSILSNMEGLLESIETFFHPSNQGAWTDMLAQIVYHLVDFFVMRWNREQSGEMTTPPERRITEELKKRFVLCLKEVVFLGLFCKKPKAMSFFFGAIQGLSYLEPHLIVPGALQRFYPSLQGLVEVHRTQSSLLGLQMIANVMSKSKGLRCHITALLALALPGIDANDLQKTMHTLNFIQSVAYSVPFIDLTKEHGEIHDSSLAIQWVQGEMERMEDVGPNIDIDYRIELSDEDEENIVRSSTAGFGEFVLSLLGKIFTLLENIPELSKARSGSPEESVVNTLPSALTPLFAALSPEIFDQALEKIAAFVSSHVVHQARDAMAFICNALCKANPEKTLKIFVPMLIIGIRNEIDYNDAASDRSAGSDLLPRDRALVWYISMLSMIIVHVGDGLMPYKEGLFDIALYMQEKCRGIPTIHASNYIHHLLLNLTLIYPVDSALYEPETFKRGLDVSDWGKLVNPNDLTIKWHLPSDEEIKFAVELFESQVTNAIQRLTNLISENPDVSRKGKNKEWSDEVSRHLSMLRLMVSGVATLFDPKKSSGQTSKDQDGDTALAEGEASDEDESPLSEAAEDAETRPQFHYRDGYLLEKGSPTFEHIHKLREDIGYLLSRVHNFLGEFQEDDVACFTSLYQTYRTWITDVGNERSAHMLERVSKLYDVDIRAFKCSGLRKPYPRPLLIKRASIYHFHRVKHNSSARHKSDLDKRLLLDLASSAVSSYAEVRVNAQAALESALKSLLGGRPLVIPELLKTFRVALETNDYDRIKGSLYTLLYGSLTRTLSKDWRFAPELVDLYIKCGSVDKPSIQRVSSSALYGGLMEFGKSLENTIVIKQELVDVFEPTDDNSAEITARHSFILERRNKVEEKKQAMALKLIELSKKSHWKIAQRCTLFILNAGLRIQTLASPSLVELAVTGAIDEHPGLRAGYGESLTRIFNHIETRAIYGHSVENWVREKENSINKVEVAVQKSNPNWTKDFLDGFESPESPEYFVGRDHPGWLVWGKTFSAVRNPPLVFDDYDELETSVRKQIGSLITVEWYRKFFDYMKQEPRDATADRFRGHHVNLLIQTFDYTLSGLTVATLTEIKEEIKSVFGDGSDKHQHRATAEILAALLIVVIAKPKDLRKEVWDYGVPILLQVFADGLTPENITYWMTCLHMIIGSRDPRQSREIFDSLTAFRLDMSSNAAFKESSKVQLLEFVIQDAGWHFRAEKPILEDFLAHIDHPYKAVREAIGRTIASIYRTRYYEAFPDIETLLADNKASSSIGIQPYTPTKEFATTITGVFQRLEAWRGERSPGQQTPSSYTSGSKTVLLWLDTTLQSYECTQLVDFFPDLFMEEMLHMMDVKEDPELQRLAYLVYRHLPNIPFRAGQDGDFIAALVRIGKSSISWHQRLRILINMQTIYFRRIFLIKPDQQKALFDAVAEMLEDPQHEVRSGAAATLSGMIRCSPITLRNNILSSLKKQFTEALRKNPMPKRTPGTNTPINNNQQVVKRHAAVLGLGALVTAFPYMTPPPVWMPEILALLASRAANDAGAIGKTVKTILADFKKTRQDTWTTDQKYFTPEQLEDLEGVLWKSYFA